MNVARSRRLKIGLTMEDAKKLVGRNIERLCNDLPNKSKSGLAQHCKVSAPMVSRWCAGGSFPLRYLPKIARYFGVKIAALFEEDPSAPIQSVEVPREISLEEAFKVIAAKHGLTIRKIRQK